MIMIKNITNKKPIPMKFLQDHYIQYPRIKFNQIHSKIYNNKIP
jgi:hypothetical protein